MIEPYGPDLLGDPWTMGGEYRPAGPVAENFLFAPFTVLDAKSGEWQERKRAWIATGIESEIGRNAPPGGSAMCAIDKESGKIVRSDGKGRPQALAAEGEAAIQPENASSIFDPVLCELAYRWFCPPGGQVLDPFAGGSVRGIIANALGRKYWGCDLRREQIIANQEQGMKLELEPLPDWICGDSIEMVPRFAPEADLVFTCPPYGDLEVYSDDPADLSSMEHDKFLLAYDEIIRLSIAKLKPNRFAMIVVGDFRDKRGFYRNFVSDTITAFQCAGAELYNEAILCTPTGSAGLRVTKQFNASRKFVKTHQNILIFCKGDPRAAADACKTSEEQRAMEAADVLPF